MSLVEIRLKIHPCLRLLIHRHRIIVLPSWTITMIFILLKVSSFGVTPIPPQKSLFSKLAKEGPVAVLTSVFFSDILTQTKPCPQTIWAVFKLAETIRLIEPWSLNSNVSLCMLYFVGTFPLCQFISVRCHLSRQRENLFDEHGVWSALKRTLFQTFPPCIW